jgi:hypothetical protein
MFDKGKSDDDLKKEEVMKYLQIQSSVDRIETLVGQWNPLNKFNSVYRMLNLLQD